MNHARRILAAATALASLQGGAEGVAGDFDGDGREELLLRHSHSNAWRYYALADREAKPHTLPLPTADVYRLMGIGDFDGDGGDDVLLQRRDTAAWLYYAVQAPDASPRVELREGFGVTEDPAFEFRGIGDIDGDGRDDLLLRDTGTGEWVAHLMDGTGSELHEGLGATRNLEFVFAGLGDFNGDGRTDLLLRHASRSTWISYEMGADVRGVLLRPQLTRNPAFEVKGIGDLNADGRDDVLLRSGTTGEWIQYEMGGSRPILHRHVDLPREAAHAITTLGDFDGDGDRSMLLRHRDTGEWVEWDVAGAKTLAGRYSGLPGDPAWRATAPEPPNSDDGLWTTEDGRIVLELRTGDATGENLFDLGGATVMFTPDGAGGYAREVRAGTWENDLGDPVRNGAEVALPFSFDFGGDAWDTVRVHRQGLLAFGDTYIDPYWDHGDLWGAMKEYARLSFVSANVVAPLYKPLLRGGVHVARSVDRVVVTWSVTEWSFHVHGVAPHTSAGFQAVLHADGRVTFHYRDVRFGDGVVGLFPREQIGKGELLLSVSDASDDTLPGRLDLIGATIHESTDGRGVVVEFATRDPIPEPGEGEGYHYSLLFDFDEPYWEPGRFWEDLDFQWTIDLRGAGQHSARNGTVLPRREGNRIAMLGDLDNVGAMSGSVVADAVGFDGGVYVAHDRLGATLVRLPSPRPPADLSRPAAGIASEHGEVFHYRRPANLTAGPVVGRLLGRLGDKFDFLVFHSEFRIDAQENGSPMTRFGKNVGVQGVGDIGRGAPQYEATRIKGGLVFPVWMGSRKARDRSRPAGQQLDEGLVHIAHEFTHLWTARASYDRNGRREPLFAAPGSAHWRNGLHLPAAFPWRANAAARTSMGGRFWQENGDGTFDMVWHQGNTLAGGPAWLDLYAMGMADATEVRDLLLLRNLEPVTGESDRYTATKEIVTVDQIVSTEGPRLPSVGEAQRTFNLGFVYLPEPGKMADPDMLELHRDLRDKFVEYWAQVTGGRSEIMTSVRSASSLGVGAGVERIRLRRPKPGNERWWGVLQSRLESCARGAH